MNSSATSGAGPVAGPVAGPLAGLRVLDLSRVFAGPVAGRVLSDLGADVVKVEPPDGDVSRNWGRRIAGLSTYFVQQNVGKRNICVDLNHPDGVSLILDLAAVADVVIENFRPGVLASFGLDWVALSSINPRLLMLSISGFGQEGPESRRAAYASIAHAEMGLIARGPELGGAGLHDVTFSAADVTSGLHGVIGILAALRSRDSTGLGQHLDIAMVDAIGFSDDAIIFNLDDRKAIATNGEVWEAVDGPIVLAGGFRWVWSRVNGVLGVVDPAPPDCDLETKIQLRHQATTDYFCSFTNRAALCAELDRANLAWGVVRTGTDIFDSPTLRLRNSVVEVDNREGGTRRIFQSPYRFSSLTSGVHGSPRHRGEDNVGVLMDWLEIPQDEAVDRARSGAMLTDQDPNQKA
jgi:CoA:oxalate CoA-transferase